MGGHGSPPGKVPFELTLKDAKKEPAMKVAKGYLFRKERPLSKEVGKEEPGILQEKEGNDRAGC